MDEIRNLTNRMCLLEKKNRILNHLACMLVLVLAATLVMGQVAAQKPTATHQDVVRAKHFVLVDDDGDCRASLGFTLGAMSHGRSIPGTETVSLSLKAKSNRAQLTFMVMSEGGSAMRFIDSDGKTRLGAGTLPSLGNDNANIKLMDENQKDRLSISLEADGNPSVQFKDKDGGETTCLP